MPLRKAVARTRDVRPEEAFVDNESDERGARLGQGEVDVTRAYGRTGLIIQDVGTKGLARKPEVSTFSPLQRHVTPNEVAFLNIVAGTKPTETIRSEHWY